MKARMFLLWFPFAAGMFVATSFASAQELLRQKLTTGHVPIETLRPALEKVLSPEGRFVILPGQGQIMVIDRAENIAAAANVIALIESPPPRVALDFAFATNLAPPAPRVVQPPTSTGDFPIPIRYLPPRVLGIGGGMVVVVPAHPTGFARRNVGNTLETTGIANPDGSIALNINVENVEFEGFINYGSAIFTSGVLGMIPVANGVPNPRFFGPILQQNNILVPIFETTRINTQILVYPNAVQNQVTVDLVPQLEIEATEPGTQKTTVPLKQFRTTLGIQNGERGRIDGFTGANADFNRHFLGDKDPDKGGTAIQVQARLQPGEVKK